MPKIIDPVLRERVVRLVRESRPADALDAARAKALGGAA